MRCHSAVKWFDAKKGFGFLAPPPPPPGAPASFSPEQPEWPCEDVFVHYSQIATDAGFRVLRAGEEVAFDLVASPKGWHARRVCPLASGTDVEARGDGLAASAEAIRIDTEQLG